jgi:PilZ domain
LAHPEPISTPFQLAVGVLGVFPCPVAVVTSDPHRRAAEILAVEDGWLRCSPFESARTVGEPVTLVLGEGQRAGYEIDCTIAPPQANSFVRLAVIDVRRVKPRRRRARADVSESALVRHEDSETEVDVRVVDISSDGLAFVSSRHLVAGDSVSGMLNIDQRAFPIKARVAHAQPVGFGRFRIGCQFTRISEVNRKILEQIARHVPSERRGLRPIELVENASGKMSEVPPASLSLDQHETATIPTVRYCRPCGRVTLQHDTAAPGHEPHWRCWSCR